MKKCLKQIASLAIMLILSSFAHAQWVQVGSNIYGEAAEDYSGVVSMPDANTVAIGAYYNDGNGTNAGHVRVYCWNGIAWVQKGMDIDGKVAYEQFGWSVWMPDANTVAIGTPYNESFTGHVGIYIWNVSSWVQKGNDIDGEAAGDWSGYSVSMPDANTVAIGAKDNNGNGTESGQARIYSWDGSCWIQKGMDINGEDSINHSGHSVSMPDLNTVAIGAPHNDGNGLDAGHVRIYSWSGSSWVQRGNDIDGEAAGDCSGYSVSMPDANTVAIGAPGNDGSGADAGQVRIYSWNGSAWVQKGNDIDGEAADDLSGWSVSMPNANTVAIGFPGNQVTGNQAGYARIYSWNGIAWLQKANDIVGETLHEHSSKSISMPDANTVAIGAPYNHGNGFLSGYVRIFSISGSGIISNDFGNTISLYPNPTTGKISIQCENMEKIELLDITGRIVYKQVVSNNMFDVDISTFNKGVYFIKVTADDAIGVEQIVLE